MTGKRRKGNSTADSLFHAAKKKRQYPSCCQKRKKRENAIADTSKIETFCTRPSTTEAIHELSVGRAYGVVVSMFDFHRSDQGSNRGRGGNIS